MGTDKIVANRKGKEFLGLAPEANGKPPRKSSSRRKQKKMSKVQKLYEVCKEVFANCGPGIIPTADGIERLKSVMDGMTEMDLGVNPTMPFFRALPDRVPNITYLHLFECDKFSIGIFCLPPYGVIPLHNHPGMTVFSKLLFGTMHIKSYDWAADTSVDGAFKKPSEVRLAKVKVDTDFNAPCNTSILYPADGGNLHCFTASTPCAVLDVLGPPYSDPDGRHCTYYLDYPFSNFSVDGVTVPEEEEESYVWLEERKRVEGLSLVAAKYPGPKIVVK